MVTNQLEIEEPLLNICMPRQQYESDFLRYLHKAQAVTLSYMSSSHSKVRLEDHEPDVELKPGTAKSDIVELLYRNDEYGYQPQAVHEELGIPHNTAKGTLRRLKKNGYVDQTEDGFYHARDDREDLFRYVGGLDGLDRMFAEHEETKSEESVTDEQSLTDEEIEDAIDVFDEE